MRKPFVAALAAAWSLLLGTMPLLPGASPAHAQAWQPSKPIKLVISFGPGSASDALARIAGQELSQRIGQPVVTIHKPGADGAISAVEVQRSAPDGTTFFFGTNSALVVVPNMRKQPPYDPEKDFTPVTFLGDNTFFVVINPEVPAKSVAELVAYGRANPGKLNYAAGNTFALVATGMFARNNGITVEAIPYKSEPDAIPDVLSGRVQLLFGTSTSTAGHIQAGKMRVLATTFHQRSPLMPDVPSIVEAGQKPFPIGPWFALLGPAGLPAEIVERMHKEMAAVLAKKEVVTAMNQHGFIPRSSTPQELAAHIKDQLGVWKEALKAANIDPQ